MNEIRPFVPRPAAARRTALVAAFAVLAPLLVAAPPAAAQDASFPSRPIRFVVPYPPGGGNDDVARMLSARVGEYLGQPVVVENKPGASGMIAGEFVSRSAPDGYTIMIDHSGIVMNPWLYRKVPFDVRNDLAPVTQLVTLSNYLLVHPSVLAKDTAELIAYAKANPGKLNYSSPGNGSPQHIDMELFKKMAGIDLVHVPYKGGAPATMAILSNEVQALFSGTTGIPHVRAGKLRALGNTGLKRSSALPEVPTIDESGLKGYSSVSWMGIFVPARTPEAIVARLNAAFVKALKAPDLISQLAAKNMDAVGSSPDVLRKAIADDMAKYGDVIKEFGIKAD
ncbi:MAG: Bug family tripartite tricarboxylate transporter substrate binding protein [Lautropia sp.]